MRANGGEMVTHAALAHMMHARILQVLHGRGVGPRSTSDSKAQKTFFRHQIRLLQSLHIMSFITERESPQVAGIVEYMGIQPSLLRKCTVTTGTAKADVTRPTHGDHDGLLVAARRGLLHQH